MLYPRGQGHHAQCSSIRRKICHAPNTASLQHDSSIRTNRDTVKLYGKVPPKRAIDYSVQRSWSRKGLMHVCIGENGYI